MLPQEVLKKIQKISVITLRMVQETFAGQYQSVFKGRGMEFDSVREYQPGDEIRSIDWNVTARTGRLQVKKFVEERELAVMILLDASLSCRFGSNKQLKSELAAEICSVIAFSAIHNNDKVGLLIFADRTEKFIPPKKGINHVLRIVREALVFKSERAGTNLTNALQQLNMITHRKTVCFIISDFLVADYQRSLSITNKKHDLIAIRILDPRETEFPNVGLVALDDAETQQGALIDTSSPSFRRRYRDRALNRLKEQERIFAYAGVDSVDIHTGVPYMDPLIKFFRTRERRLRKGF